MTREQYLYFQKFFHGHAKSVRLADFFATKVAYLYVVMPFVLMWWHTGRVLIVSAGAALVLGWGLIVQLISYLFPHKRPYQQFVFTPAAGRGLFSRVDTRFDAFPSGHTTAIAILTFVILLFSIPFGICSALVLCCTAIARVLLGYHYPFDIFGGLAIAFLVVYGMYFFGVFSYLARVIS